MTADPATALAAAATPARLVRSANKTSRQEICLLGEGCKRGRLLTCCHGPAGPSPIVAYRLCGPGRESGEALLKSFKEIRRTLEHGSHTSSPA